VTRKSCAVLVIVVAALAIAGVQTQRARCANAELLARCTQSDTCRARVHDLERKSSALRRTAEDMREQMLTWSNRAVEAEALYSEERSAGDPLRAQVEQMVQRELLNTRQVESLRRQAEECVREMADAEKRVRGLTVDNETTQARLDAARKEIERLRAQVGGQ